MTYKVFRRIDELGRIVVPKELRVELGIENGDEVMMECDGDCIIIRTEGYYRNVERKSN